MRKPGRALHFLSQSALAILVCAMPRLLMDRPGQLSYATAYFLLAGLILAAGYFLNLDFVADVSVGLLIGRKLGWVLSPLLYRAALPFTIFQCLVWGALAASLLASLIHAYNPGIVTKIFAYGAGAYVSIPNFGLVADASVPAAAQGRHLLIQVVPFLAFVGVSVWLAFHVA